MDLHASLAAVSVRSMGDARKAAEAMRDIVLECTGLHVIAVDNIASKAPMEDIDGNILAADVFGWTGENEHWWKDSKLALSSPLPRACRYESEPFWCNEEGARTLGCHWGGGEGGKRCLGVINAPRKGGSVA